MFISLSDKLTGYMDFATFSIVSNGTELNVIAEEPSEQELRASLAPGAIHLQKCTFLGLVRSDSVSGDHVAALRLWTNGTSSGYTVEVNGDSIEDGFLDEIVQVVDRFLP